MTKIEYPVAQDAVKTPLPFSPATKVGDLLFISGQASTDDEGKIVPDTFENEFHRMMQRLIKTLEAAGSDLAQVCQVRGYIRNADDFGKYNELYRQYFKPPFPARTTIMNCLGKIQVEMECIAVARSG